MHGKRYIPAVVAYLGVLIRRKVLEVVFPGYRQIDAQLATLYPYASEVQPYTRSPQIKIHNLLKEGPRPSNQRLDVIFNCRASSAIIEGDLVVDVELHYEFATPILRSQLVVNNDSAVNKVFSCLFDINERDLYVCMPTVRLDIFNCQ